MASVTYKFSGADAALRTGIGRRDAGAIFIEQGEAGTALHGPYIPLPAGTYSATIRFRADTPRKGPALVDVAASSGNRILNSMRLADVGGADAVSIDFVCHEPLADVEVRLRSGGDFTGVISGLEIDGDLRIEAPRFSMDDLPKLAIQNTISRNRNLYDGYQRGVGLQFSGVSKKILADPDYREARELAGDRTIIGDHNLCNIFMIIKFYLPRLSPGHIAEFGSYKGGGAIFMAALARKFLPGIRVLAFDTFAGMPPTDDRVDHHKAGSFGEVDLRELRRYASRAGLTNLEFIQGDFAETAKPALRKAGSVSCCHVDCDIRSAIECAYEAAKPHMVPGGYWIFDDPMVSDCLGAAEAMEDLLVRRDQLNSEQVYPHYVFRQPFAASLAPLPLAASGG